MLDILEISAADKMRKHKLGEVVKEIHKYIPVKSMDSSKVGKVEIKPGYLNGKRIKRLIIYMRSSGCEWMLHNENGGCFMCGHLVGTTQGKPIPAEAYRRQIDSIIDSIDLNNIPMVCIYNAGSFFNNHEMPPQAREHIYHRLDAIDSIESIIFESRPEYIKIDEMMGIRAAIPDKRIEIGIGLESSNEYIRQMCLNKGSSVKEFRNVIPVLKEYDIQLLAYILQKPPFVNERRAIDDAVASINWVFSNGIDVVSLEPVSVQKNTLVHLLYNMGLYQPPWIWSVMSVIKDVGEKGLIRIGGFEYFPPPDVYTHNCPLCNDICMNAIELFNATNDIAVINDTLNRPCKNCSKIWLDDLTADTSIADNVDHFLQVYDKKALEEWLRTDLHVNPGNSLKMNDFGIQS